MRKSLKKIASERNGLSRLCSKCPIANHCNLTMIKACSDNFVEGFLKGYKYAKEIS